MLAKKNLEINPHHSLMKEMLQIIKDSEDGEVDDATKDYARLMYQMALLNSGFDLEDPVAFTAPL